MKAVVILRHGDLDQLVVKEMPAPRPAQGEVVIEVHAAALNHLDLWVRKGARDFGLTFPHILGSDAAGVVVEVGETVEELRVGDEVILDGWLCLSDDEFVRAGEHSLCASSDIVGIRHAGTFAERVSVPARNVLPRPPYLNWEEAAALTLSHLTAWRMLMTRAALHSGETVLIHGIGGGVALAGLQLAKLAGAEVIVTSSSDEKLARALGLGADHTINYRATRDVAGEVRQITAGRGVDVVLDTVGAATLPISQAAARRGGRIVICGVTGGAEAMLNLHGLYWNQLSLLGSTMGNLSEFRQMLRAVSLSRIRPVIDSAYALEEVRDATARMEAGKQFGKIVLRVRS